ncbi:MAG: hypothetical protein AAB955_01625 [Patescibacteria group bacterium]
MAHEVLQSATESDVVGQVLATGGLIALLAAPGILLVWWLTRKGAIFVGSVSREAYSLITPKKRRPLSSWFGNDA